ncbi:Rrf2 family transcriptional regulator [Streptomyces sp. NPDC047985]|uniref:RrF2 family transcriptional regulator n=1 Tax=unclassified Streptomyces TaxID=2593676 RepID=UPI003416DC1A
MRLTKFTDVALRVLMRLAVVENEDDPPTTREVAATMQVPYTHTAKVVARLQHLGLVEARRGRGGGLSLTGAGRSASIGGLVRELEGPGDVVECEGATPCPLRSACRLRGALRQAEEAFYASLDPITVDQLVASPTGPVLIGISGIGPAPG